MRTLWTSFKFLLAMSLLTGIVYPFVVTGLGKTLFERQANGSLLTQNGKIIGSELIAQKFSDPKYFWPRPSAADFGTLPSGASNLGPTSVSLKEAVSKRLGTGEFPKEMIFASASGLDPHVSPEAALAQISRVAKERALDEDQLAKLKQLVYKMTEDRELGFLGEPGVNVLKLNIELDRLARN